MRIQMLAEANSVRLQWRPFLLGPIFKAQGLTTSPFNIHVAKGSYMLRDMRRLADKQGIPFAWPKRSDGSDGFPRHSLLAARVARVGVRSSWCDAFTRATFQAEFGFGADISKAETIINILKQMHLDPTEILTIADSADIKSELRESTDEAISLGIFGSPSFTVGTELFWGDDRLEAAIEWVNTD